jgi:glycosyltransferase involved in cell wall biosynthesis
VVDPNTPPESILVSIGLPVYNGEADLPRALHSLTTQTHRNLEIIISDNASTDATPDICRHFAARDPRIRYRRQAQNIGGAANFEYVLRQATGPFFMWAACDDWWASDFVRANLLCLLQNPRHIASMSALKYADGDRFVSMPFIRRADTRPLIGSVAANVRHYVANSGMNSRFYALFRRDVLLKCLPFESYTAADNALIVRTLAFGTYGEVRRVLFHRGMAGESAKHLKMLTADRGIPGRFLPLWRYSRTIWRMPHVKHDIGTLIALTTVNTVFSTMLTLARIKYFLSRKPDKPATRSMVRRFSFLKPAAQVDQG